MASTLFYLTPLSLHLGGWSWQYLKFTLMWKLSKTSKTFRNIGNKVWKYGMIYVYMETYLLNLVRKSINDFSQAYIFIILIPVITSLMVLILSSVRTAVLFLRGQTWKMSLSDHSPTFCSSYCRRHREGSGIRWFPTALLCWHHRWVSSVGTNTTL